MKISIVVSVYNEETVLESFYEEVTLVLRSIMSDCVFELIFVNDGSTDDSRCILEALAGQDAAIKVITFSKNFGHEAAMIAGIDEASGDFIVCMDADLQHPPKAIRKLVEKAEEGYDVVNMVRVSNRKEKLWKRLSSKLFYKLINTVSQVRFEPNASDFFMISKKVADIFRSNYREKVRFLRGYIQLVGFKKSTVEFHAPERFSGESKYSALALIKFAIGIVFTFSNLPLRLGLYISFFTFLLGLSVSIYSIVMKLSGNYVPDGYTSIIVLLSFFFSVLFLVVGIIGEYLRMIFEESKERPIYIIESKVESRVRHE